jgi:hypothetical protein
MPSVRILRLRAPHSRGQRRLVAPSPPIYSSPRPSARCCSCCSPPLPHPHPDSPGRPYAARRLSACGRLAAVDSRRRLRGLEVGWPRAWLQSRPHSALADTSPPSSTIARLLHCSPRPSWPSRPRQAPAQRSSTIARRSQPRPLALGRSPWWLFCISSTWCSAHPTPEIGAGRRRSPWSACTWWHSRRLPSRGGSHRRASCLGLLGQAWMRCSLPSRTVCPPA